MSMFRLRARFRFGFKFRFRFRVRARVAFTLSGGVVSVCARISVELMAALGMLGVCPVCARGGLGVCSGWSRLRGGEL